MKNKLYNIPKGISLPKRYKIFGDASKIYGVVSPDLVGDVSKICGDVTGIIGDLHGVYGHISGITGDVSGLSGTISSNLFGDVSGLSGYNRNFRLCNRYYTKP